MNKLYRIMLLSFLPILAFTINSCEEDDEDGGYTKPSLWEVFPEEGLIGSSVTVKGTDLQDVIAVKFGNIDVTDFTKTDTSLTVQAPQGLDEGETHITVFYKAASENNLGPSSSVPFIVLFPPVLSEVVPTQAKPGFDVAVSGNSLKNVTEVRFGDIQAAFEATQTSITTTIPLEAEAGEVEIIVESSGGTASIPFTVLAKTPEIYSIEPLEVREGEEVSIQGLFFMDVASVFIGNAEVQDYTVLSSTEINFTVPEGAVSDKVIVNTAVGSAMTDETLSVLVPVTVPYTVYEDNLIGDWEKWDGWSTSEQDLSNADHPQSGSNAIKIAWNGAWGGFQLHPVSPSPFLTENITKAVFSVYGGPGSDGKIMMLYVVGSGGESTKAEFQIAEGKYTTFEVTMEQLGNPPDINEFNFQNHENAELTVYVDDIRFE